MTTPPSNLPREFWVIVSDAIPLVLAATPVGESSAGKATIVATLIALHLWVSAASGRPSIPLPPSAEDLEELWHEYGDVLMWAGHASGDANAGHTTAFDSRATSDLIEEATTFWWRASRFMMFRALVRDEPFGLDR